MTDTTVESYEVRSYDDGRTRINLHLASGSDASLVDLDAWRARLVVGLLRHSTPVHWDPEKRTLWVSDESTGTDETAFDLDAWLANHPAVRKSMFWQIPATEMAGLRWNEWSDAMKGDLRHAVATLFEGGSLGITDPPPLAYEPPEWSETQLAEPVAWSIFIGHVAQSIFCDASGSVSWSLGELESSELDALFDSRSLHIWNSEIGNYTIDFTRHGNATPGDPAWVFKFLATNDLVGDNRVDTIHRFLGWGCSHLMHYFGGHEVANHLDYWQYRGEAPVRRILEGTLHPNYDTDPPRHWTAGCHGTVGLLRAVLRTVNIPVEYIYMHGHAQPHFVHEDLYLSHGDDCYVNTLEGHPSIPASLLPIDQALYDLWFGDHLDVITAQKSVGRRPLELAIEFLPDRLLRTHCQDLNAGNPPEESEVYENMKHLWTLENLKAEGLWWRMDEKLTAIGGCTAVATKNWGE